jgi:hypothetical protein
MYQSNLNCVLPDWWPDSMLVKSASLTGSFSKKAGLPFTQLRFGCFCHFQMSSSDLAVGTCLLELIHTGNNG